jgi:hypothetical protein
VVPVAAIGVPTLLLAGVILAQVLSGVALLPAIRQTLGTLGIRRAPGPR